MINPVAKALLLLQLWYLNGLIFKQIGVNKYARCLKCVTDDYKNVMLF